MTKRFTSLGSVLAAATVSLACTAGVAGATPSAADLPNGAPDIAVSAVQQHLQKFQQIAEANGGNRSTGSSGYRASVEYVEQQASSSGYQVKVQRFDTRAGSSANVVATLPGEDPSTVIMLGAHLDSVARGPGINDNGSGSATLLAVAKAFAEANPNPPVTVRFGWWGAEEQGLLGSGYYVDHLSDTQRSKIDAYLNFDMVASPNAGYFLYGNSQSLRGVLTDYFATIDVATESIDINGRSDHVHFARAGIDVLGLFTGAEKTKSPAQASKWGGTAGRAFDPCYHSACDTLENINETALERNSDAVSYSLWELTSDAAAPRFAHAA